MQSFEQSLVALIANQQITMADALTSTLLPGELKLMMDKLGIDEEGNFHQRGLVIDEGISF
jgi:Tfp pilus assembly ATPase PilU